MNGEASRTTGTIVSHERSHERTQRPTNALCGEKVSVAIAAAMPHVIPD